MRILFVTGATSIHTVRWIRQLDGTGWDIHIVDPGSARIHPELAGATLHTGWRKQTHPAGLKVRVRWPFRRGRYFMQRYLPAVWQRIVPDGPTRIAEAIQKLHPDVIHSQAMQYCGYPLAEARKLLGGCLPAPWIYSSWGSDMYYWGRFPEHQPLIREVLRHCDYLMCNCERDVRLAREFGFQGGVLGLFQGGGGFPIDAMQAMRLSGPISSRRVIAVKGQQNFAGRALTAIEALKLCVDDINRQGYEVVMYLTRPQTEEAATRLLDRLIHPVRLLPRTRIQDIWRLFGTARIALGVNESDGVPNAMLEAMIMGAFPIQTDPGGATSEWVADGVNGLLIPHDDPQRIAEAIRRAMSDDALVNEAAEINDRLTRERVEYTVVRDRAIAAYERAVNEWRIDHPS